MEVGRLSLVSLCAREVVVAEVHLSPYEVGIEVDEGKGLREGKRLVGYCVVEGVVEARPFMSVRGCDERIGGVVEIATGKLLPPLILRLNRVWPADELDLSSHSVQ